MIRLLTCTIAIVAMAFALPGFATDNPNYHELRLKLGTSGKLKQVITLTRTRAGAPGDNSITSEYIISYIKTDTGFRVTKTLQSANAGALNATHDQGAVLDSLAGRFSTISYVADDDLTPVRLEDWEGFKASLSTTFKSILKADKGLKPEVAATMEAGLQPLLSNLTAETAPQLFLQTDTVMSTPRNIGLTLNIPVSAATEVQSPLGGRPIAAHESLTLTRWDEGQKQAHITYSHMLDPTSLKAFLMEAMPAILKNAGLTDSDITEFSAELTNEKAKNILTMSTVCDYDIAIATGLIDKGACTRTTSFSFFGKAYGKTERHEFSEARID